MAPRQYEVVSNDLADADFVARIYMIANVCHTFVGTGTGLPFFRERAASFELGRRWAASDPASRRWIEATVAELGDGYVAALRRITEKGLKAQARQPVNSLLRDLGLDENSSPEDVNRALNDLLAERGADGNDREG